MGGLDGFAEIAWPYKRLNQLLPEAGLDEWLEALCVPYYSAPRGQ